MLLVTQDFPPAVGGIQTYSKALADCLHGRCERFGVIAPYHAGCQKIDRDLEYPVYRMFVTTNTMRYALLPFLALVCKRGGYRTALLAQWYSGAAAGIAKRWSLLDRVFCAAHGQELLRVPAEKSLLGRAYVRHRQRVLADIDGFFPVSHYTASLLTARGVDPAKVQVVFNGTDLERFRLSPTELQRLPGWRASYGIGPGPLLLTAARLVRRKGIDTVLQALPALARAIPDVQYAVVGSGPERNALEQLSRELGIAERVFFLGQLDDREVVMAYHACDTFVMPAREEHPSVEGFGLVFREANACGKPAVGARTGGIADAIEHERTGLLVEPDRPEALEQALRRLLTDPGYASALGTEGRRVVESSGTWQHAADLMLSFMHRVSRESPPHRPL